MKWHALSRLLLSCAALTALLPQAGIAQSQMSIKVGVLTDMSGPYANFAGAGAVVAAELAIEDHMRGNPQAKIELLRADHQNKADIAVGIARRWYAVDGVHVITELVHSASALAVTDVAREVNRVAIVSGSSHADLFGPACTPNTIMWTYDSWAMAAALGGGVVRDGGRRWFFLTSDSVSGAAVERDLSGMAKKAGGEVVGRVRVPINTSDMTSFLLQASSSGADVIALALGGADLINAVKQAQEFQVSGKGRRIVSPVVFDTDVHSLGLAAAQHLRGATAFYWDLNDETRAFAKRFAAKHRQAMPTMVQAGVYAGIRHYLKAATTASPTDGRAVVEEMKRLPTDDPLFGRGSIRIDGRKLHPMYLFEVKTPAESKGPWDYLKIGVPIPAEEAIRPLADGGCPLASR